MLTHTWVEQYRNMTAGPELAQAVRSAVHFDFGDADEVPVAKGADFADAKPPFNDCVLQFTVPNGKACSHVLILWRGQMDGSVHLMSAWKFRGIDGWRTTAPREITRTADGFHYEGAGYEESVEAVQRAHAMALNAFYILGCANVRTVEHAPPAALNKKREKSGKFPILTHKTLVVVTDAPRYAKADQGGAHGSPRVHLRRGHIRRLDDVRRVWVQPCVVGSKHGVVTKDYRVTTLAGLVA
jgi:hypothetical protein